MNTQSHRALEFAKLHDWGRDARLTDGGANITGLLDSWTRVDPETGEFSSGCDPVTVPASVSALREFGGY